jgi:arginine utilization protein RocB
LINRDKLYNTFLKLVSFKSISGTKGEVEIGNKLIEMLDDIKVAEGNELTTQKIFIDNDRLGRFVVFSHLKGGDSKDTIILTGHMDVVDVEEFAEFKECAFDPEVMTSKMKEMSMTSEEKADFDSGEWLFGRGTADMKFGIALDFEMIKYYASLNGFKGNLIFMAVPGEETNSEGIREALNFLPEYQSINSLDFKMAFLSECFYYDEDKPDVNFLHYGSEGKLMPMMLFVGKSTHANNPYGGIDSNMISSEFFSKFQLNNDFISGYEDRWSEPPICLKTKDFKKHYSAKPAVFSLSYFNLPTINSDYSIIMSKIYNLANETMDSVIEKMNESLECFNKKTGSKFKKCEFEYNVLTYEELYKLAFDKNGKILENKIEELIEEELAKGVSLQDVSGNVLKIVYSYSGLDGNSIIISMAPPFYPSHLPEKDTDGYKAIEKLTDDLIEYSHDFLDIKMERSRFYQISDLAFLPLGTVDSLSEVYNNMPGNSRLYNLPVDKMNILNIPTIVLGPLGKDFHKKTERLNIEYALNNLPKLYVFSINSILNLKGGNLRKDLSVEHV